MSSREHFKRKYKHIATCLSEEQFNTFILEHLSVGRRGPKCKLPLYKVFNYILLLLHTGMQWASLPIVIDPNTAQPEIHYTRIFRIYQRWVSDGSLQRAFDASVQRLDEHQLLDCSILHGDGSLTSAKKGGDGLGFSGHKHCKGEKVIAIVDRNVNVITPYTQAPANRHEGPLFFNAFFSLKSIFKRLGKSPKSTVMSLDSAYDSRKNRKLIFNAGMIPNIPENKRNRKRTKSGPARYFDLAIFQERFQTIERLFAWEDKFKRLLLRFEHISTHHFGMKLIAFTMINLRHFC